jgi:hypothetical protein
MRRLLTPGIFIFLTLLVAILSFMAQAATLSFGGRIFPMIVGTVLVALICGQLVIEIRTALTGDAENEIDRALLAQRLGSCAWVLGLLVGIWLFGALLALPAFLLIFMLVHGERLLLTMGLTAVMVLFLLFVVREFLHITLPDGLVTGHFFR